MRRVRVGAAVLNQTPLNWESNRENILGAIEQAKGASVSLLCLPELCISGYGCEDSFFSEGVQSRALQMLLAVVPSTSGIAVSLGLPVFFESALYNAAALVADGRLLGVVCKQFLANEGIHYERRWFRPWPAGRRSELALGSEKVPIGDLCFDLKGIRVGFEICEDAWAARRPGRELAARGVDVILNPSASHFAFGKVEIRKRFVIEGSRAFHVSYVYSNLLGNESGRAIYDGGALIASGGRLVASGPRFGYQERYLTYADVDVSMGRLARTRGPDDLDEGRPVSEGVVRSSFGLVLPMSEGPTPPSFESGTWETSASVKEEEFARAVSLGLFDYMRKSRSKGFVVSLSGGADSSAVSCLAALMVHFSIEELGREGLRKKLPHFPELSGAKSNSELVSRLLTCVYQSTENSSSVTREAARAVAEALGATFVEMDVGQLARCYVSMVETALKRKLRWETDDVALQNVQARVRGPAPWLVANIREALLLATSNRSEAAVGYTTMDGDTCGGLSPVAGIDKAFLRRWLVWLEERGPAGAFAVPALRLVNIQAPTAELRPPGANQTDEGDLMPYSILDRIERLAIRDKRTPAEVFEELRRESSQYSDGDLRKWIRRFFVLWCRNQWKRERYAPSFHLDDESLDPKTWCRFPILSGGYESELKELGEEGD